MNAIMENSEAILKKEMSVLLDSYEKLKENKIDHLIKIEDMEIDFEENKELESSYEGVFLRRKLAKYKGIIVGRILYSIDFDKNEANLLMIDTLNDCKHFLEIFEDDELSSNNIIEKGLGTKLILEMIEELKMFQIKQFYFQSLITSVGFYNKILQRLKDNGIIKDFKKDKEDNLIYDVFL